MTTLAAPRTDERAERAYQRCDWAELVLYRHGWTGERLQKTARRIVNDYTAANIPYLDTSRRDAMVDFIVEKALQVSFRFKPDHPTTTYASNGGSHFDSWICDQMNHRCTDWLRSKAEGNGDRRYANDNRIILMDMGDEVDDHFEERKLTSARRIKRWMDTAERTGFSFEEFTAIALDAECQRVERTVA